MQKYRSKPKVVEACQFDGTVVSAQEICKWIHATPRHDRQANYTQFDPEGKSVILYIETLEGMMEAAEGDWVIKGVKGEFYPCKPDIFPLTYESVEDARQ